AGNGEWIYTVRPDGSARKRLTRAAWGEVSRSPRWSRDGRQIAFVRGRFPGCCPDEAVWTMTAAGKNTRPLTDALGLGGEAASAPAWAPGHVSRRPTVPAPRPVELTPERTLEDPRLVDSTLEADGPRAAVDLCGQLTTWDVRARRVSRAESVCGGD